MTKFRDKFFCPAPWSHLYYQMNSPSPCHIIRNNQLNMTVEEYHNSDWLKEIKTDMVEGRVPKACSNCKAKEDLGLKSTRGAMWKYYGIGPEPEYENMWFYNKFDVDTPSHIRRLELRFSNLCNMKCRMCDETSSSEWALEKKKYNLAPSIVNNIDGLQDTNSSHVIRITEDKIDALKNVELLTHLVRVCFTGGEPLLIKEYYDYMDFLIDSGLNKQTDIELFTNCSVYNPLFVDRLNKFKHVELTMSLDGVGKTAEYIRHGMPWSTIQKNVLKFNSLPKPIKIYVNVAISAYTLLDVSSLAKFLMELYETNPTIGIKCYTVLMMGLRFQCAPNHLQKVMLEQLNEAIDTLTVPNFDIFRNELINLRTELLTWKEIRVNTFYDFTKQYDEIRNESFEETFGLKLYPPAS